MVVSAPAEKLENALLPFSGSVLQQSVLLYGYYAVRKDICGSELNIKEEPTPKRMVKIAKHGGFLMKILMNFCFLKR